MANVAVDIGTGATAVFGTTSTYAFNWTSMSLGEQSYDAIDTTHLGTTGHKTQMMGDLINPGEITLEFQYDNETCPVPINVAETLTITFPQAAANATSAANYAGTGFIKSVTGPTLGIEELQTGTLVFAPDGATDFVYTNGV